MFHTVASLPKALERENYGALAVLLFVFVGAGVMIYGIISIFSYRKFGSTLLFLNPESPGVGGQLGGKFDIKLKNMSYNASSNAELWATLSCLKAVKKGSRDGYHNHSIWTEKVPVYLNRSASGLVASFLFDIPKKCKPTANHKTNYKLKKQAHSIRWSVSVIGEIDKTEQTKFFRSWPVVVDSDPANASQELSIPQSFVESAEKESKQHSLIQTFEQFPITEDTQYLRLRSNAKRHTLGNFIGIFIGLFFAGIGVVTVRQDWWPGYIFIALGSFVSLMSLYVWGKAIETTIDKHTNLLTAKASWFGIRFSKHESQIDSPNQFFIKNSFNSTNSKGRVEYFTINFKSATKRIRIIDGLEGRDNAEALKDELTDRLQW